MLVKASGDRSPRLTGRGPGNGCEGCSGLASFEPPAAGRLAIAGVNRHGRESCCCKPFRLRQLCPLRLPGRSTAAC